MSVKKSSWKSSRTDDDDDLEFVEVAKVKRKMSYVLYGRSGTGKTTIAGSFPKPAALLDIRDDGTDSVKDRKGLFVLDVKDWDHLERIHAKLKENKQGFKTVILDTLTQMQQLAVEHVLSKAKKPVENAGGWGSMTKQQWGDVARIMKDWIIRFRDLPMEVVFIAHDRTFNAGDEDDTDNILAPEVAPRLSPSVVSTLTGAVSFIGYTFLRLHKYTKEVNGKKVKKERIEYCLLVGPDPLRVTKTRKGKDLEVPRVLVDPDYETIQEALTGE